MVPAGRLLVPSIVLLVLGDMPFAITMGSSCARGKGCDGLCFAPGAAVKRPSGGLIGRRLATRRAALPRCSSAAPAASAVLRPIGTKHALAEDGIVSVQVDAAMVDEMQRVFEDLRATTGNQFRRCGPVRAPVSRAGARENILWTEQVPCDVEASNFRLADSPAEVYDVYTTGFAPTMRWVAVGDRRTLDRWHSALGASIQQQLEEALNEPVVLCQACFVVVRGGVGPGDAKLHADWAMEAIPRSNVFTALTPLTDFPADVGGLFFDINSMPKNEGASAGPTSSLRTRREVLHRYSRGEAVLFDGKLMHRTEPFSNTEYERVLASFSFCTAASRCEPYLADIIQVLDDQTPAFYVSPAGKRPFPR